MSGNYYDVITKLENFADGLIVIDNQFKIIYHKQFLNANLSFNEKNSIGKKLEDIFVDYDTVNSPLYRAIKYGEPSINKLQKLHFYTGEEVLTVNTVFPIKKDNVIIGAVSMSQIMESNYNKYFIDISDVMLPRAIGKLYTIDDIIGTSKEIERLKSYILKICETKSNVLIYGETGTGKELIAQSIHSHSKRNTKPFITQNCAAIPPTLLESIFFGTTKGSFTGAIDKPGIFELANGGTIFLDEVNSMDLNLQAKILRALECKTITRVGGSNPMDIDVRIIAATNQDPKICITKEILRMDLYYRLSSVQIKIPALRERIEDIYPLVHYFIDYYNNEMKKNIKGLDDEAYTLFKNYDWPGNVRELKNVLETAFNLSDSSYISVKNLPEYFLEDFIGFPNNISIEKNLPLREAVEEFEKSYIISQAVDINSLVELADKLHISKQLLNHKIKKYDLKITFR